MFCEQRWEFENILHDSTRRRVEIIGLKGVQNLIYNLYKNRFDRLHVLARINSIIC